MEKEKYIGESKLIGSPKKKIRFKIGNKALKKDHLSDELTNELDRINDLQNQIDSVVTRGVQPVTDALDEKYANITNELYSMINALQVGGVALSQQFGNREDIGISQKTLTKALGKFWEKMEEITGDTYMDFTLTVVPTVAYTETYTEVTITADCSDAISNFDSIKIYVNNELVAESENLEVFTTTEAIDSSATIRAVGTILGKTITKTKVVTKEIPLFMGSGSVYTDVVNETCRKELVGTLEGDYDVTVRNNGEYMFIIIPISTREQFRRADMNGYEIPFEEPVVMADYVVYKSLNTYNAGVYNVDIDINS